MNAGNVLKLNGWVVSKKNAILKNRPTMANLRVAAAEDLGFKVSDAAIRDCLIANDLPTRRVGKQSAAVRAAEEKSAYLMQWLIKVLNSSELPDWLLRELRADTQMPDEVRSALEIKTLRITAGSSRVAQ